MNEEINRLVEKTRNIYVHAYPEEIKKIGNRHINLSAVSEFDVECLFDCTKNLIGFNTNIELAKLVLKNFPNILDATRAFHTTTRRHP